MTYFILPIINKNITPDLIKLKFDDIDFKQKSINPSLQKYLTYVKNLIGNNLYEWDNIKKYTNPYEFIHTPVPKFNLSVSKVKPISRAFFKLIEIYNTFNIFQNMPTNINTFHLAEGPGGFIEATTFIRKNNLLDNYYGISLINNEDKKIPNWKKIDTLLKKYPNIHITYGADGTGDLYSSENLKYCIDNYKNSMEIITGDGGFDFSNNFNEQESNAFRLILTQVFYALSLQKFNGHFILKMFDLFTENSIQIIYLLSCFYKKVIISKPNTSRRANSEKYIICKNFKYTDTSFINQKLVNIIKILETLDFSKHKIVSVLDLPLQYVYKNSIVEINSFLGNLQIENINTTIKLINNKDKSDKLYNLKNSNINKCIKWCSKNYIQYNKIDNKQNIFLADK